MRRVRRWNIRWSVAVALRSYFSEETGFSCYYVHPPPWCVWLLHQTYMSISKRPLHSWIHFFFCFPHRLAGLAVLSPLSCSVSYSFRPSFTGVDTLAHILLVMIRHSIRWSRSSGRLLSSPDSNDFRPTVFFLFWLLSCAVVKVFSSRPPHFPLLNLSFLAQSLERDGFVYVAYQWCGSIHPLALFWRFQSHPMIIPWWSLPPIRWYMLPLAIALTLPPSRLPPLPPFSPPYHMASLDSYCFPAPSPPILYPLALARA